MKKILGQISVFLLLVAALTLIRFPYNEYVEELVDDLKLEARKNAVHIESGPVALKFPLALEVSNLELLLPTYPSAFPFQAKSFRLATSPFSVLAPRGLIAGHLELPFHGEMDTYGGKVSAEFTSRLFKDQAQLNINAQQLDLAQHPWGSRYGVKGELSFVLDGLLVKQGPLTKTANSQEVRNLPALSAADNQAGPSSLRPSNLYVFDSGKLSARIQKASYSGGQFMGGIFSVPAIEDGSIDLKAKKQHGQINIESLTAYTSQGEVQAFGTLIVSSMLHREKADLSLDLKLTPQGYNSYGALLAFAAKSKSDPSQRKFKIKLAKADPRSNFSYNVSPGGE